VASLLEFYRTLNTGPGPQVAFEINRRGSRRRLTLEKNGRER